MDNKKYAVILAAGDGKRMKSDKPKVLAEVLFQPMLRWVLDAVKQAGVDNTAVIVGAHKEQVTAFLIRSANTPHLCRRKGSVRVTQ